MMREIYFRPPDNLFYNILEDVTIAEKEWYGVQEAQGETTPLCYGLGELLSSCQYEAVDRKDGRMVAQTNTHTLTVNTNYFTPK